MRKWILIFTFFLTQCVVNIRQPQLVYAADPYSFPEGFYGPSCTSKLDPQTQVLIKKMAASYRPAKEMSLDQLRQSDSTSSSSSKKGIKNLFIATPNGEIPIRLYRPNVEGLLPVLIFFHGGGWVLGTLDEYDSFCRTLASQASCLVVSVDYHLAPEYKFPKPLEDCYAAALWVDKHIQEFGGDPKRVVVAGDSAGGNLATALTLMARDRHGPNFIYQVLIYPVTDYNCEALSCYQFAEGYTLSLEDMQLLWSYYLKKPEDGKNAYASPLKAKDLSNLPPTLLVIADYDILRDSGLAYGWRLYRAGNPIKVQRYNSVHGFLGFEELEMSKIALQGIISELKQVFKQ